MSNELNRRKFIASMGALAVALPLGTSAFDFIPSKGNGFNFVLLGDLHYDKLEHHDMDYVKLKYPNDITQIENYSRITRENLPLLLEVAKEKAKQLNVDFWLQLGDFVEGLCGSEQLATKQVTEFIALVKEQELKRPFFVIKGNHDVTGEGANEMYNETVLPWQSKELKTAVNTANATFVHKKARFIFFDCYRLKESMIWLKRVLAEHKEDLLFFSVHAPIIPFDARSNWHVFGKPGQEKEREELVNLLGKHRAIVLCGHLHKTSVLTRTTPEGSLIQVCVGSVIPSPDAPVKNHLKGVESYNADLVNLEPRFSPTTLSERKVNLENEKPFIKHYEYADFCGYANVMISAKNDVDIVIYKNVDKTPWTTVRLTDLPGATI
ncbi:metallophosphoesterase family protein [Pseudopedobacter saltans]|nr:metallophosphoesterase [Pseudopedobacter saltans]